MGVELGVWEIVDICVDVGETPVEWFIFFIQDICVMVFGMF